MQRDNDSGCGCFTFILFALIVFGISKCGESINNADYVDKASSSTGSQSHSAYTPTPDEIAVDDTGYNEYIDNRLATGAKPYKDYYHSRTGDNYLDFKTSGSDYVIIVKDYSTDKVVNHIYVRADGRGRLYLPDGTYNIFFYSGKGWDPEKIKGGVKGGFVTGEYLQKDGPVELYNQYGEYTLYPVQNGNLTLERASDSEAF